jgi:cytochrome c oxidase assembly factor CtaG
MDAGQRSIGQCSTHEWNPSGGAMMNANALQAALDDWTLPVPFTCALIIFALLYALGWMRIRRTRPKLFPVWRLVCFEFGLAVFWGAVASPMDELADALLSAHMVEHLLIMSVVPPLVLLGAPVVPLLRGLPRWFQRLILNPLLRRHWLRDFAISFTRPLPAWLLMNIAFLAWHVPAAYDFALDDEFWHGVEHLCFFFTSLLFWGVLLRPWPANKQNIGWMILPYLVGSDIVNTIISASLAFCGRPVYQYYVQHPNPFGVSLVDDQVLGASIMWVFGSLVFLGPAMLWTMRLLERKTDYSQETIHPVA